MSLHPAPLFTTREDVVPKVFLIAQPTVSRDGHLPDLTPLAEHGEVVVLVTASDSPTFRPRECREVILRRLLDEGFDAERDFLVWAGGDTLAAVLAGVILERLECRSITWLRFERGKDSQGRRGPDRARYRPIKVALVDELTEADVVNTNTGATA